MALILTSSNAIQLNSQLNWSMPTRDERPGEDQNTQVRFIDGLDEDDQDLMISEFKKEEQASQLLLQQQMLEQERHLEQKLAEKKKKEEAEKLAEQVRKQRLLQQKTSQDQNTQQNKQPKTEDKKLDEKNQKKDDKKEDKKDDKPKEALPGNESSLTQSQSKEESKATDVSQLPECNHMNTGVPGLTCRKANLITTPAEGTSLVQGKVDQANKPVDLPLPECNGMNKYVPGVECKMVDNGPWPKTGGRGDVAFKQTIHMNQVEVLNFDAPENVQNKPKPSVPVSNNKTTDVPKPSIQSQPPAPAQVKA